MVGSSRRSRPRWLEPTGVRKMRHDRERARESPRWFGIGGEQARSERTPPQEAAAMGGGGGRQTRDPKGPRRKGETREHASAQCEHAETQTDDVRKRPDPRDGKVTRD